MKKPARTPAQRLADKEAEKRADILRAVAKCGMASRSYFERVIKRAGDLDSEETKAEFERLLRSGAIKEGGRNGAGDVVFFEAEKII